MNTFGIRNYWCRSHERKPFTIHTGTVKKIWRLFLDFKPWFFHSIWRKDVVKGHSEKIERSKTHIWRCKIDFLFLLVLISNSKRKPATCIYISMIKKYSCLFKKRVLSASLLCRPLSRVRRINLVLVFKWMFPNY